MGRKRISNQTTGQLKMAGAMLLAGSSVPAGKMLTNSYSVFFIGSMTMLISIATLLPFQVAKKWEIFKMDRREWIPMILQSLFGIVLFRIFSLLGLRYTSGFFAGVVTSTSPLFFALFAFIIFKDKISGRILVALILGFGGILWMNLQTNMKTGAGRYSLPGLGFMVLAVVSEVFLTIFRKGSSGKVSSSSNTLGLAVISLFLFSLPLMTGKHIPPMRSIPFRDWAVLFYYGGVPTTLGYILWGDGALKISTIQIGMITLCMPLSATALSLIILGERPGAGVFLGALLVFGGLILTILPKRRIRSQKIAHHEPINVSPAEKL